MAAQIGYYDTLKSVAGKVLTYLASITLTGTDGKTITVTQDTSLTGSPYTPGGTDVVVADGGTGASTLTDHGVLVGSGTDVVTALAVGTNGQVIVGSTGADPVFATITDGEGIDTTLGAGTLTIACEDTSETNKGIVELATDAEAIAGSDTARAITASNLKAKLGTQTDGAILVGAGQTGAVEAIAVGATTELLVGGGAGTNPVWTAATGTGAPVRADSPSLATPALGTPASGTLTNCTGLPAAGVVGTAAIIANTIKGDGTAGRVQRLLNLEILNGTNATTIKCQCYNQWNGDVVAQADNIPKGGSSGAFALNAAGDQLTISDSAISGDTVAALVAHTVINQFTTSFNADLAVSSGIRLSFSGDPNGGAYDLTSAVDTGGGTAYIHVLYITSA